eukprot:1637072-Ditylum_brightwellii.AAC.1
MQTEPIGCAAVEVGGTLYVMGGGNDNRDKLSSMETLQLSTPSPKASITSCLDALEEAAELDNDSSAFKKCIESL